MADEDKLDKELDDTDEDESAVEDDEWDEEAESEDEGQADRPSAIGRVTKLLTPVPRPVTKPLPLGAPLVLKPEKKGGVEDMADEAANIAELSPEDREYLIGGTDDEMVSYPKEDIISLSPGDKEFLLGNTGEDITASTESLTKVTDEDMEYLIGGLEEVIGSRSDPDAEGDISSLLEVSEKDREFLFGGTEEIVGKRDEEELVGVNSGRAKKVKYSVGGKKGKRKSGRERDRDIDKFIFESKGVL